MRRVGPRQREILPHMQRSKGKEWSILCGWSVGAPADTERSIQRLVDHGLAVKTGDLMGYGVYRITRLGEEEIEPKPGR